MKNKMKRLSDVEKRRKMNTLLLLAPFFILFILTGCQKSDDDASKRARFDDLTSESQPDSSDASKPEITQDDEKIPFPTLEGDNFSILFAGNSHVYTGDIPEQLKNISGLYGIKIDCDSVCLGGNSSVITKKEALDAMRNNKYDIAVFQNYYKPSDIDILCAEAKNIGAIPVIYAPAYGDIDRKPIAAYQQSLTLTSEAAAKKNQAILVNAGEAWAYAYEKFPDLSLYANDYHATGEGAYLTACVFASVLFDLHIKDVPEINLYTGDNAAELGLAAWEYVSYYKAHQKYPDGIVSVPSGTNEPAE